MQRRLLPEHLMLVPSSACPASCSYCFGPHLGGVVMGRDTLEAVVEWQHVLAADSGADGGGGSAAGVLDITFHGGEPLVPGLDFYRVALPLLREALAPRPVRFSVQSNLWLLSDELADLFKEYGVGLGTSLDGPEAINDAQRGSGYFARTMAGIRRARAHGLDVGALCTLTAQSASHADEIFEFFLREGLNFSLHAALPSLRHPEAECWSLAPEVHGDLLVAVLERYLDNLAQVRIGTLDSMAQSISAGRGGICIFDDCLGGYMAVGPDGAIYPCQRFVGMDEYRMGDVATRPSLEELQRSAVWRELRAREDAMADECDGCAYLAFCRGGCPYNAVASGCLHGRDPHCAAYRRVFAHITERALAEVFAAENLEDVITRPGEGGLLRRGRLLSLMREG